MSPFRYGIYSYSLRRIKPQIDGEQVCCFGLKSVPRSNRCESIFRELPPTSSSRHSYRHRTSNLPVRRPGRWAFRDKKSHHRSTAPTHRSGVTLQGTRSSFTSFPDQITCSLGPMVPCHVLRRRTALPDLPTLDHDPHTIGSTWLHMRGFDKGRRLRGAVVSSGAYLLHIYRLEMLRIPLHYRFKCSLQDQSKKIWRSSDFSPITPRMTGTPRQSSSLLADRIPGLVD
jgi:hypothetical protein